LYVPVVGTALKAMGFVFLSRNWESDKRVMNQGFASLKNAGTTFWFFMHPEGGRITKEKTRVGHIFAESRNLPKLDHVLLPRVKGFTTTVSAIDDSIGAIYDLTIAYAKPPPSLLSLAMGPWFKTGTAPSPIDICVRRFPISNLPKSEEEIKNWLYQLYKEKDETLGYWKKHNKFPPNILPILSLQKEVTWESILFDYLAWLVVSVLPIGVLLFIGVKLYVQFL